MIEDFFLQPDITNLGERSELLMLEYVLGNLSGHTFAECSLIFITDTKLN